MNNPLYEVKTVGDNPLYHGQSATVYDNPAYEVASRGGENPLGAIAEITNPLHKGYVADDGYEYVLHGTDADLDAWLSETDVVVERSPAGGLTYAVVRTMSLRDVPASLLP